MVVAFLGVPSSAGAYAPGQEKAVDALRRAGLLTRLRSTGLNVTDLGDTSSCRWRPDRDSPKAMNLQAVARIIDESARRLKPAFQNGHNVLVIGGDCTIEIGTVRAAASEHSIGLIYVDRDADLNTPCTTDEGALDWMGIAHLLGLPGTECRILKNAEVAPLLKPAQVLLFATSTVTMDERAAIESHEISEITIDEVLEDWETAARRARSWAEKFTMLLIHVDVDVLDFLDFPLAENTRRPGGIGYEQLFGVLRILMAAPNCRALTITEMNPDHCPNPDDSFSRLAEDISELVSSCWGGLPNPAAENCSQTQEDSGGIGRRAP